MLPLKMTLRDGATAEARLFRAGDDAPALLVLPAMGVNARAYDRLGEELAGQGVTAMVLEHRGGGSSSVRPRRGVDYGYVQLLDDAVVHLEELAKLSARPVSVLGHSLGGQLATMGLAAWHRPGAKVVVIASGTVHSTAWKGLAAFGVYAGTQLAGAVARGLGYFPGHRLGFGGLQGRTLIVDWARAAKTGHFGEIERELERFTPEVLAIHVEGDTMAPRSATEGLIAKVQ
jgi:predicted alpha/beta hydrolase